MAQADGTSIALQLFALPGPMTPRFKNNPAGFGATPRKRRQTTTVLIVAVFCLGLAYYWTTPRVYHSRGVVGFGHSEGDAAAAVSRIEEGVGEIVKQLCAPQLIERTGGKFGIKGSARDIQLKHVYQTTISEISQQTLQIEVWAGTPELARNWTQALIDEARLPEASIRLLEMSEAISPRPIIMGIASLVLAIVAGLGHSLFRTRLNATITNAGHGQSVLGLRNLGAFGGFTPRDAGQGAAGDQVGGDLAHHIELIRARLFADETSGKVPQVVMIASAMPGEGKTLFAHRLAISCAAAGKKTLLIDADLEGGDLHRLFGYRRNPGLSEVLSEKASLEAACRDTSSKNLSVITAGQLNPGTTHFAVEELYVLVQTLRRRYDFIVFDTSPLLAVESAIPPQYADGILLVVRCLRTFVPSAKATVDMLREAGGQVYGFVLSGLDPSPFGATSSESLPPPSPNPTQASSNRPLKQLPSFA